MKKLIIIVLLITLFLAGCQKEYHSFGNRMDIMERQNFTTYKEFDKFINNNCENICDPFKYDIEHGCDYYTCVCRG